MRFSFYSEQLIKREETNGQNLGKTYSLTHTDSHLEGHWEVWFPKLVASHSLISAWAAAQTLWVLLVFWAARLSLLWDSHVHAPQCSAGSSALDGAILLDGLFNGLFPAVSLMLVRSHSFCPIHTGELQSWLKCTWWQQS